MKVFISLFIGVVLVIGLFNVEFSFAEEKSDTTQKLQQLIEKLEANGMLSAEEWGKLDEIGSIDEMKKILKKGQFELPLNIVEIITRRKQTEKFLMDAKKSAVRKDIVGVLSIPLDLYEFDNEVYPTSQQGLDALVNEPTIRPLAKNWNGPYLKKIPEDPWGKQYVYLRSSNSSKKYELFSCGPDGKKNTKDDIK